MDRLPLIGRKGGSLAAYSVASHDQGGPSPICGPTAFARLMRKKETAGSIPTPNSSHLPVYHAPKSCIGSSGSSTPLSLFGSRSSYEEMSDQYQTSEDVESCSGSEKGDDFTAASPFLQFHPTSGNSDEDPTSEDMAFTMKVASAALKNTQNRPRISSWSSNLEAVTEETQSFDETKENTLDNRSSHESDLENGSDEVSVKPTPMAGTPRAKKEMLMAMRNLILKQQDAMKELSEQNEQYRKKIGEYQSKMIEMKQENINQQVRIDKLALENEASAAECLWLREELKNVQVSLQEKTRLTGVHFTGTQLKPSTNDGSDKVDDCLEDKFTSLLRAHQAKILSSSPTENTPRKVPAFVPIEKEATTENKRPEPATHAAPFSGDAEHHEGYNSPELNFDSSLAEVTSTPFRDSTTLTTNVGNAASDSNASQVTEVSFTGSELSSIFRDQNIAKPNMAQFKQRLENIQKKRSERRNGRFRQISKPSVHFGSTQSLETSSLDENKS